MKKANPFVNEFYDRALREKFRVAEAGLRQVDVAVAAHSPGNPHVLTSESFVNPCDRLDATVALVNRIDDFIARYERKVMEPKDFAAARLELRDLLDEIEGTLERADAVADFELALSDLKPADRAAAIEAVPFAQLREFLRQWEGNTAKPLINRVSVHFSPPDKAYVTEVFMDASAGRDAKTPPPEAGPLRLRLDPSYRPKNI